MKAQPQDMENRAIIMAIDYHQKHLRNSLTSLSLKVTECQIKHWNLDCMVTQSKFINHKRPFLAMVTWSLVTVCLLRKRFVQKITLKFRLILNCDTTVGLPGEVSVSRKETVNFSFSPTRLSVL